MNNAPDSLTLSVIIVSYNTRQMTLDCLRRLGDSLGDSSSEDLRFEVWVVDNGSTDGSDVAIRDTFPLVRLIENSGNAGFGAANNQAMRQATGEFFLLLNSDAFPDPGAIEALLDYLRRNPQAALVGPRLLNTDRSLQRSCYRFPGPLRAVCENLLLTAGFPNSRWVGDYRRWSHDQEREVEFAIGACLLVRGAAVEEVGFFDESFFLYAEEADWCYRFQKAGWRVGFTPRAQVVHLGGASGKPQADRVFCEFHKGQERFIRKHHGVPGLVVYRTMLGIGACIRMTVFSLLWIARREGRTRSAQIVRLWWRILKWTLGLRGPGLAPSAVAFDAQGSVAC